MALLAATRLWLSEGESSRSPAEESPWEPGAAGPYGSDTDDQLPKESSAWLGDAGPIGAPAVKGREQPGYAPSLSTESTGAAGSTDDEGYALSLQMPALLPEGVRVRNKWCAPDEEGDDEIGSAREHGLHGSACYRMQTPSPERSYVSYQLASPPPVPPQWTLMSVHCAPVMVPAPQAQTVNLEMLIGPEMGDPRISAPKGGPCREWRGKSAQATWQDGAGGAGGAEDAAEGLTEGNVLSVGSVGHPYTCGEACKYARGHRVCKAGERCDHCHICHWRRCAATRIRKHTRRSEIA